MKRWLNRLKAIWEKRRPFHLERGRAGELAARRHLQAVGMKFLACNYSTPRGEIDLVFRDGKCLVFVEVKTRSERSWTRPSDAVNEAKRRRITKAALEYLRLLKVREVPFRFDIVEVVMEAETGGVRELRHLENAFTLSAPYDLG